MTEQERTERERTELSSSRWRLGLVGVVVALAGLALLGTQTGPKDEPTDEPAVPVETTIITQPSGDSPSIGDDGPGESRSLEWAESGSSLDLVLAVGSGSDGFVLLDLRDGSIVASAEPVNPVLIFPEYIVADSGLAGGRLVLGPDGQPVGELPNGAGIMRHPNAESRLWTFARDGKSRREFYVFSERDPEDPETVLSEVATPQLMLPIPNSDGPQFVAGVEGGIYELHRDSTVTLRAPGLPVAAVGGRLVTWVCDEHLSCALSVSDAPEFIAKLVESTGELAGHDGSWTISSDGEWAVLRDVVKTTSFAVNLDSGEIVAIDTLAAVLIADGYAFWTQSNQVFYAGLVDGVTGTIEVPERSRVTALALGPPDVLAGYS